MRLAEIRFETFRNLVDATVTLDGATTVLLGENGQGKTNFLEAVGVLATTKSFRGARPPEMVAHGAHGFRVAGRVETSGRPASCVVSFEHGQRVTAVDERLVELADYVAQLTVVPVTQAHAAVIRGAPQERRDFLDRGILGVRPSYLRVIARYRRTVKQKSALLRSDPGASAEQWTTWNERLAVEGAELIVARREYVAELSALLPEIAPLFLPAAERVELELADVLSSTVVGAGGGERPDRHAVADALRRKLAERLPQERAARQALVGPHRDDLLIRLAGRDVRRFASSGQQRSALLALKLAKIELFRRRRGETPVLLVDDVDTEIDSQRLTSFLAHVGGRAQTVLTSSKRDLFPRGSSAALFYHVREGLLTQA